MDWIMLVIAFIIGAISMFMLVCISYAAKQEEPKNMVHFYIARDKNDELWLYMGKPIRIDDQFSHYPSEGIKALACDSSLKIYGLNENDYANLKWEDEPLEVFVNMED